MFQMLSLQSPNTKCSLENANILVLAQYSQKILEKDKTIYTTMEIYQNFLFEMVIYNMIQQTPSKVPLSAQPLQTNAC